MLKKIQRILCLLLLAALLTGIAPWQQTASAVTVNTREQEVIRIAQETYEASRAGSGYYSFFGYCGTMVSWQLHILGITAERVKLDGKNVYDYFRYQTVTSGGFPVTPYSGSYWNLYTALNYITENGTKDAYNIVVGFEYTPSAAGSMYGHGLVIFGIIDGIVYYNESGPTYPNGVYYPEGSVISATIENFSNIYSYAVLDGLVHFGRRTYSESCTQYPAFLYAAATQGTALYTEPCLPQTDERSQVVRSVQAGEYLSVIGLYVNSLGEYWYQVEEQERIAYIPAPQTRVAQMRYEDVTLQNEDMPGELRQGRNHWISGNLSAVHNRITTVRAQLFAADGTELTHVCSTTETVDARRFSLYRSDLTNQLALSYLESGSYRLELAVVVGNNYYADGGLQTQWKTIKVWQSEFMVVPQSYSTHHVHFDAAGGTADLLETSVYIGDRIARMPEATRPGYVFEGWYTADGVQVTERTVIAESMTLYARWTPDEEATGWYLIDETWCYLTNGSPVTGFVSAGDVACYIQEDGTLAQGWVEIRDRLFYFQPSGAMYLGWLQNSEGLRYFTANGAAVGSMVIDEVQYFFDENGILQE